jgi:hypothetical protein
MTESTSPDYSEKSAEEQTESKQKAKDGSNQPEIFKSQSAQGGCLQLFLGFLASLAFLAIAFFIALFQGLGNANKSSTIAMTGILLILFLGGGMVMWRYSHLRMFVIGYLTGLGLSALAFGLCYSAF